MEQIIEILKEDNFLRVQAKAILAKTGSRVSYRRDRLSELFRCHSVHKVYFSKGIVRRMLREQL